MNSLSLKLITGLIFILALVQVHEIQATTCTPGNQSKFVGLKAPIKQIKNYNESPRNRFVISGTVEIVDGCKFVVRDFKFPNNLPATWYGKDQKETEGYRIIQGIIAPSNGEDKIFSLSETPGNSYDWNDFDTVTVFYKDNVYAEAHFPELEPDSGFLNSKNNNNNNKPHQTQGNSASLNQSSSSDKKKTGAAEKNPQIITDDKNSSNPDNHHHNNSPPNEDPGSGSSKDSDSSSSNKSNPSDPKKPPSSAASATFYSSFLLSVLSVIIAALITP